jgi:hypothetical protein
MLLGLHFSVAIELLGTKLKPMVSSRGHTNDCIDRCRINHDKVFVLESEKPRTSVTNSSCRLFGTLESL